MTITCKFNSPEVICKALGEVVKKNVGQVSCRPYNYTQAKYTDWFLVPSTDWPAYKYGKFFSDWHGDANLLCGLLVEKGLDPSVEESKLYTSQKAKRCIMRKDWLWFQFLEDLRNGRIESAINHLSKNLPVPIVIRFSGGYFEDPAVAEPYESLLKHDIYLLQYSVESNLLSLVESKPQAKLFTDLEYVKTFNKLVDFVDRMNKDAYLWLDTFIGLSLRYKNIDKIPDGEREGWDEEVIWDRFLKHFLPWFK
ncbi:MAG: hypothetical protein ACTSQ8_12705 [Candidatus Helarchaeota archaeon]